MTVVEPVMPALSVEEFRRVFGLHPWHFWGMANTTTLQVTTQSDPVLHEYAWQSLDDVSRSDLVDAIRSAERLLRAQVGYRPGPQYVEETLPWPRLGDTRLVRSGPFDARGGWLSVRLSEGMLQAIGTESLTLLGTPAVVYSDPDNDTVNELATITVATTVTDATQLAVYFQASDRLDGDPVSEVYRIRPVRASIAGGVATILIPSWLLVRPINYQGVAVANLDPAATGVLATAIDVYQRTTSGASTSVTSAQGVITWETRPCHGWWCCCGCNDLASAYGGSPYDPAAVAQAVARVGVRNALAGVVIPAEAAYDATAGTWSALDWTVCWEPDRVTVRYLAGVPSPDGQQLAREWQTVVARLAAAELGRPLCAQGEANRELYRWQYDLARASETETYSVSEADLNNPFGTRRGHIQAWHFVSRLAQQRVAGIYAG